MYQKHFGLTERPFSIAPDPRFLYMSQQHREALAHLLYGVGEGGGFVQLTGEVGTGKTTICRCLLEQLPGQVDMALILNPRVNAQELLASLCDELHIQYARDTTSIKVLTDLLNAYLLDSHSKGRRTVLMIDEAQNLSAEALEQVRLLTNLETTREKLLQIILVGQPELRSLLAREELRQLSQRITARYHLEPIGRQETAAYIRHRLQVCGASEPIFSEGAIDLVHKLSSGVPRLINVLCDRAMLGAFVEGKRRIEVPIVRKAAGEVLPEEGLHAPARHSWGWAAAAVLVILGMSGYLLFYEPGILSPLPMLGAARQPVSPLTHIQPESRPEQPNLEQPAPEHLVQEQPAEQPTREQPAPEQPAEQPNPEHLVQEQPAEQPAEQLAPEQSTEVSAAEAPPPVTESPQPVSLAQTTMATDLERALAQAGPRAASSAWAGLYRLWGVQANVLGDEQACAQAPGVGLRCLQGAGSWTVVTQLDRPAILLLVAAGGRRVPVLLHESLGATVRVQVDGKELEVTVDELMQDWLGHYRILWKAPPKGSAVLRPGYRSSDVAWLRDQMQHATGLTSIAPDPAYYDDGLKQLVQEFQREQGLQDDGIAGPLTLIHLNNLERRTTVPHLGVVNG
jgi:general secretion pathway protein A